RIEKREKVQQNQTRRRPLQTFSPSLTTTAARRQIQSLSTCFTQKSVLMAGRFDPNPFDEGDEVNPFAVGHLVDDVQEASTYSDTNGNSDQGAGGKGAGKTNYTGGSFYTTSVPSATNSRLSPLPHEPADFYDRSAPDLKKKERELQSREADLRKREEIVKRKEEAAARAGIVLEEKNWPPIFPIIHHDIANEIPIHLQKLQYVAFTTYLGLVLCLLWNIIATTTAWIKGEGFGLFCLESLLSIWVIQQVYMYFRGSGKAAEMRREVARGAVRAAV
ncbi:SCAMP-like protein, partial [Cynara cardunculus var. scolymus]